MESVSGTLASTIGIDNPFRYRGYYLDNETGFYYLNSRYYDPQVGRFINADGIIGANRDILGYNLYSYCGNNPVTRADPSGKYWADVLELGLDIIKNIADEVAANKDVLGALAGSTLADGPLPYADILAGIGILAIGSYCILKGVSTGVTDLEKSNSKENEEDNENKPIVFPLNPGEFNPVGLLPLPYPTKENGLVIKWGIPKDEVFEWNENPNGPAGNGSHYHIRALGNVHFYLGMPVPEPYATTYFGGQQ